MDVEIVPMSDVSLLDKNPRKHPEVQIDALVSSIRQFGQYRPLVVDEDGVILAGNGLYTALSKMGAEKVTIHRKVGLSRSEKDKLILADNKTGALSKDDFARIDEMLRGLDDFEVPGYDPDVLRELLGSADDVLSTADNFGVLSEEDRERLLGRSDDLEEARGGARVGSTPEPAQPVPAEIKDAHGASAICPTCKRKW